MQNKKQRIIIIGSGIAGLAIALRLRKSGHEVLVFESADVLGGKIKDYKWQDFRFDTGPSLFTLPELVDELFILYNKEPRRYFNYKPLKTVTKYFYEDTVVINSHSDPAAFAEEIKVKIGFPEHKLLKFLHQQEATYNLLSPIFIESPIHIISRLFKIKNLKALFHLMKPYFLKNLNTANQKSFDKEKHLVKIFNRYGTYNGSNPYKMPSLFNIISHLEHNKGAFLPEKGMSEIIHSLYKLAVEEGIDFKFNNYVDEVVVKNNKANGVKVKDVFYHADSVVSNMDVNNTYKYLLPLEKTPTLFLENEKSTSALIFQWAINTSFPILDVHNILFAENYEEEFNHLFKLKKLYSDPTVYIYISAKQVKEDAPEGMENWFVMINTPALVNKEEDKQWREEGRRFVVQKIKKILAIDIEKYILHENIISPATLETTTHSYLGSLYGASSNTMMSAFLRHPNFSKIEGLYFAGGTVHPGGGIPLCLLSAKITANLVDEGY